MTPQPPEVAALLARSNRLGSDPRNTNYAGGNASVKAEADDPVTGQLVSGSFLDYAIPRAEDLPTISVTSRDVPSPTNPLGVKGAGEGATVGAPGAVIHAILDALAPLGVTHIDMPATPVRVWETIRRARNG